MMDWDDLKHVSALAETGSVRRAGAFLGVHGSTVARHIDQLERRLGIKLFARTRRGMEITPAGQQVLETYERLADELLLLERHLEMQGSVLAGPVTLDVPAALAVGWLAPVLRGFALRYPDIRVTVVATERSPVFDRGAAGAAIVITDDPPEHLVGRPLGAVGYCEYASSSFTAEGSGSGPGPGPGAASPGGSDEPPRERLVGPMAAVVARAWQAAGRVTAPLGSVVFVDTLSQARACAAGPGLCVLPCVLGDGMPELLRAEPATPVLVADAWLLSNPDSRGIARLQALIGYVQEAWNADKARLEGRDTGA